MSKNNKGFTLTEVLISLAVLGMFMPLVFATFVYGMNNYSAGEEFLSQQMRVQDVKSYIRNDINRASEISIKRSSNPALPTLIDQITFKYQEPDYGTNINGITIAAGENLNFTNRIWRFDLIKKSLNFGTGTDEVVPYLNVDYSNIKESSRFEFNNDTTNPILTMYVIPNNANQAFLKNRAIDLPVAIKYSLRYKNYIIIP